MPDTTATRPNLNTYWVVPYKFLAGEYPGDEDPVRAREKINRFFEVGVRHFVDLTEFGELVPYEAILSEESRAANITATYQRFPIRDISVPRDAAHLGEILLTIDRRIREGGAVFVHCWEGVGRTGLAQNQCIAISSLFEPIDQVIASLGFSRASPFSTAIVTALNYHAPAP